MKENRFRFSHAKTRFLCFEKDCSIQIEVGMAFAYDNWRDVRICEACFYQLSKIKQSKPVSDSSPVKSIAASDAYISIENCPTCQTEARNRRLRNEHDSFEGWLAVLQKAEDSKEAIELWEQCDSIAWDTEERKQLGFTYIQHLANIESMSRWNKPCRLDRVINKTVAIIAKEYVKPPF